MHLRAQRFRMGSVTEKMLGCQGFLRALTAAMHLRAQRFRKGGVTEKKVAAQKEEARQLERRVRYGAQMKPFLDPTLSPEHNILGPARAIVHEMNVLSKAPGIL